MSDFAKHIQMIGRGLRPIKPVVIKEISTLSTRYSVRKSFMRRSWYVYDRVEMKVAFYGTYDECQMWIDDPIGLALQQATKLVECFNDEKEG